MVKLRCPYLHSFGHTPRSPASCTVPICQAWAVCPCILARSALLPVLCSRSGCAGVGGGAPAGYTGNAGGGAGESRHHRKNKKGSKITPPPIVNLKNFPQKQKDPYKGSVFCAILALQALKGRNLQWLKVK